MIKKPQTADISDQGVRLGFLLANLAVSDATRQDLVTLVGSMTAEQVQRFTRVLEEAYLIQQTRASDEELAATLRRIKDQSEAVVAKQREETKQALLSFGAGIKPPALII